MIDTLFNNPLIFAIWLGALVVSITIHEFAHAFAADRLGDPTPGLQGRLTLDPRAHLDPLGTLMILIARFGWGKPVQFDPYNLKNPRRDAAIISLAGPASNLILASLAAVFLRILDVFGGTLFLGGGTGLISPILGMILIPLIILNVTLAVFNLIPVHPLDGFKIVGGFLPDHYAKQWYELESYGFIFLLFLILPLAGASPISRVISPIINTLLSIFIPAGQFI